MILNGDSGERKIRKGPSNVHFTMFHDSVEFFTSRGSECTFL